MIDSDNWAYERNSKRKERELCERIKKKLRPATFAWKKDNRTIYLFHTKEQRDKFINEKTNN